MLNILLYIVQIVLLIIFFVTLILFILWSIGNFKNKVPFVSSSSKILENINKALGVKDNSIVYDLGCGDGRVLFYLSRFNSKAKYIGFENNLFPLILAYVGAFLNKKKTGNDVIIYNKNFFTEDLSKATHIFTYLYPNVMDELLPKLEKELVPGTRLISLSFQFSFKKSIEEIDLKRNKYQLGRKLYIYQF